MPILSQYSRLDSSTKYLDCRKAYDGLVDYGAKAHYRVKHSKNEFANGKNHINGIETFSQRECEHKSYDFVLLLPPERLRA